MEELDALGRRIERIALEPDKIRAPWTRLLRPILRTLGWRPAFQTKALSALLADLRQLASPVRVAKRRAGAEPRGAAALARCKRLCRETTEELEANVVSAERACVVHGGVPVAYLAWLRRLFEVVVRAVRAASPMAIDRTEARIAASLDPMLLLPPLALAGAVEQSPSGSPETDLATARAAPLEPPEDPSAARLVELQLAAIDHLIDAAREEPEFMAHRRRLLEAARQMLLDTSAALPLDPVGVEARRRYLAEQIVRIDRLQAAGVSADVALVHQARAALADGDRQRLHAALVAMDGAALATGDLESARRTGEALSRLRGRRPVDPEELRRESLRRSHREILGDRMVDGVERAYRKARKELRPGTTPEEREISELARTYLAPGAELASLPLVIASDGCFEVGGTLSPVRVTELHLRARAVSYPTQDLLLLPARDPSDIPTAVIEDPRTILTSLAEGRLLTRKYVKLEHVPRKRTRMVGEVRVYVLDGSGSMVESGSNGARARMRDAILLAELATLLKRFDDPSRQVRVSLYYRYFSHDIGPVTRVDSAATALAAIGDVVGGMRVGGTDIEGALIASLQQVRDARKSDPDLARAQIVLVTDGEAEVREDMVLRARQETSDVPIHVSVIALGQENPALRRLVARQRARGERAFYHFLGDDALAAMLAAGIDGGDAIHLPPVRDDDDELSPRQRAKRLDALLGDLVEELAGIEHRRRDAVLEDTGIDEQALEREALAELGVAPTARSEGRCARREALERDRRALRLRYGRWFPKAADGENAKKEAKRRAPAEAPVPGDVEATLVVLSAIADVVGDLGGTELARHADAIDLLERLLPDARLSPARYHAVVAAGPAPVMRALAAVHAAVAPVLPHGARHQG